MSGGVKSRRKGRRFEQDIAQMFREAFPDCTARRSQQGDGAHTSDVVLGGEPHILRRLWIECQHADRPTPLDKLEQAERDIGDGVGLPLVVWQKTRERVIHATTRLWVLGVLEIATPKKIAAEDVVVTMDFAELVDALRSTGRLDIARPAASSPSGGDSLRRTAAADHHDGADGDHQALPVAAGDGERAD